MVLEVSGNTHALNEAIRIAAPETTVIVVSWYQSEARGLYLADEFHHNRIGLKQSQSAHVDPAFSTLYSLSRRQEFCMNLLKQLSLDNLINMVDYQEAPSAYEHVDQHPEDVIQIVFRYDS